MDEFQMFFDRDGQPIDLATYTRLHADPGYRILARDEGAGRLVVTAWTGLNQGIDTDPPLLFGTAVITQGQAAVVLEEHYAATEADAYAQHADVVAAQRRE